MLKTLGLERLDQLFADVPAEVLLTAPLNLPQGLSEMECLAEMNRLADQNTVFKTILRGAGAYDHFIPSMVNTVIGKEEFLTAYTPYQAELSQGILQSIFEYQTMICELTGMDVSNASLYDGASAAAEAMMMCVSKKKNTVLVSALAHSDTISTIKTYCWGRGLNISLVPEKDGQTDVEQLKAMLNDSCAAVYLQQPNFYGQFEEAEQAAEWIHAAGAKLVLGVNPISLGLFSSPAEQGADIAVGEGQPLGLPLSFGGPYLGFLATKKELMRQIPGRIVGETQDAQGRRAFVLTLQAREQHIRREKASSNICSNQALCAMAASVYMATLGAAGLAQAAELCYHKAHYFADELSKIPGFSLIHSGDFFHEFLCSCPIEPSILEKSLAKEGVLCGLPIGSNILWCVTEKTHKQTLDKVIEIIREVCSK